MKRLLASLFFLVPASVQALELPSSVTVVESAGPGYCGSSWYINLNDLNFFRPFFPRVAISR